MERMSKSFYTWTKSHRILLFAILLVAATAVVGIVSVVRAPEPNSQAPTNNAKVTKIGNVVCLPHKNSDGPQTLECAIGLKGEDGKHYGLKDKDSPAGQSAVNGVFNKRVEVTGTFTQTNDAVYDIAGNITIIKLKVLE
jgi:hypothetical protein